MDEIINDFVTLQTVAAIIISFALDVLPWLKPWWKEKNAAQKQIWIIAIMFLLSAVFAGVNCYRGICPADWIDWIIVTLEGFIVNYIAANTTHYGTRHLTEKK